jgi:hypothetical protein
MSKQLESLKEQRAIQYNVFLGALQQLKKQIQAVEERIYREGDTINFSINSDFVENALSLWKASHRIYQIDDMISLVREDQKEIVGTAPDDAESKLKTIECSNSQ